MFFARTTRWASRGGSSAWIRWAFRSRLGTALTHVGERWSMVTCAAAWSPSSMAGTRVTAVAPEPTTTTRFPVRSRSSGQNCGWTSRPAKSSVPGSCGSCGVR